MKQPGLEHQSANETGAVTSKLAAEAFAQPVDNRSAQATQAAATGDKTAAPQAAAPESMVVSRTTDSGRYAIPQAAAGEKNSASAQTSSAQKDLPNLSLDTPRFTPLPWEAPDPETGHILHPNYERQKDSMIKIGEGPFHVAERLLGEGANSADVKALQNAMIQQYKEETQEAGTSYRIGHALINESNISQIMNRISDPDCRHRIEEKLKEGWTDKAQPAAIPFDHDFRPGETQPSFIANPKEFLKDFAEAAIDVGAAALRAKGQCAQGARMAFNEIPLWHIDGGTVDVSINKDPNGWRGGIKLADDLFSTGLFDKIPLDKFGYKNLKEGYMLGRVHFPDYVKAHPTWGGEDFGDIDIVTRKHMPQDDGKLYHDSYVLVPKAPPPEAPPPVVPPKS